MMAKRCVVTALVAISVLLSVQFAQAGSGTLKGTFKYKDPNTGIERILTYGYVYLHSTSKPPPMEKYFSKADYVLGMTSGSPFSISVPEGTYYMRLLQRKVVGSTTRPYGPPETGDYTWFQTSPITITAGGVLDIGTKYATPFMAFPITLRGTVHTQMGVPMPGRYVRAQTEPCVKDGYDNNINQCGPAKYLAQQPTDADGKYTMYLKSAGTYYIYTSPCLTTANSTYTGNNCPEEPSGGVVVNVSIGDDKALDVTLYR